MAVTALAPVAGSVPALAGGKGGEKQARVVTEELDGPRGVDHLGRGLTVVGQGDGTVSLVVERYAARTKARAAVRHWAGAAKGRALHRGGGARVYDLTEVPAQFIAPAVSVGKRHTLWILTVAGEPGSGAATLYKWRPWWDAPRPFADIAAYQATDPDPYDLEDFPEDTNPYGVEALRDGTVLVADAAGNDLLRVYRNGSIRTVARLMPRTVEMPDGLPPEDPDGNPLPPPGTPIPSEGVATSVTVGPGGHYFVGELRGFPGTAGTSQVWKVKKGSLGAVCDPEHPYRGACTRYADGLTSIVDLGSRGHRVYALSLSKLGWLPWELGTPGAEVGGLFELSRHGHRVRELAVDQLILPGGVDSGRGGAYVTAPVFGPGQLLHVR